MNRAGFWRIMDDCRLASKGDTDLYRELAEAAVRQLAPEERRAFRTHLASYFAAANECVWVDMACKVINGYVSDDTGLYFALWLVAQGENVLLDALRDPDTLADLPKIPFGEADFELLMSVGFDEDDLALSAPEIEPPEVIYRRGDKFGGYASFEDAMADIPNQLPRLIARAEAKGFGWRTLYGR